MSLRKNSGQWSVVSDQKSWVPPVARIGDRGDLIAFAAIACMLLVAGCRQDMHNQPKMIPQRGSDFFADHRGSRPQIEDTVARDQLHEDSYFYTPGVVQGANGYREELDRDALPGEYGSAESAARSGSTLLHALPLASGQWPGRDCGSRLQACSKFDGPGETGATHLALLLRDDAWLWLDARLLGAVDARGSVGGCRLHSRAATQPGQGHFSRRAQRGAGSQFEERSRGSRTSGLRAALGAACNRSAGIQADRQRRNAGDGSSEPGRSGDHDTSYEPGPRWPKARRSKVGRTRWLTILTHHRKQRGSQRT